MRSMNYGYYALRFKILERDSFTCQYCGQHAPNVKLEVDHKVPVEDGGTDSEDNLTTSCYACNRGRSGLKIILKRGNKTRKHYTPFYPIAVAPTQDDVFKLIEKTPGLRNIAIAKEMDISTSNANMTLSRLKRKGKIVRDSNGWRISQS